MLPIALFSGPRGSKDSGSIACIAKMEQQSFERESKSHCAISSATQAPWQNSGCSFIQSLCGHRSIQVLMFWEQIFL